jgi:hypothetical protein
MSPLKPLLLATLLALLTACGGADHIDLTLPEEVDATDDTHITPNLATAPDQAAQPDLALDMPGAPSDAAPDLPSPDMPPEDMAPDLPPDMPPVAGPARYPASADVSPATAHTQARWAAIRAANMAADERVFIKVGASGTVNTRLLTCFEPGSSFGYDLDGRTALQATIDHFRLASVAGGTTSFARASLAAEVGRTARWSVTGSPSPVARELAALHPRYAFVNYGTNDMGGGATYESALWSFWTNMNTLLDALEDEGTIPIITGLNPRGDNAEAASWVPLYDAMTRGLAEQRQLPYLSLYLSTKDMPAQGLISDGLHGNAWSDAGKVRPCHFAPEAMDFNYNLRNLRSLELLDRVRRALLDAAPAPDAATPGWQGAGSAQDPFIIDSLPFTHHASTRGAERLIDAYPSCDNNQDEGGGELHYRLVLDHPATVRFMSFDREADVDIHLLGADGDPQGCLARHDRTIERALPAGTYTIIIDSYVSGGVAGEGEFLFVAAER